MMVGDGEKKGKGDDENSEQIDRELVPSSEKPQEVHGELEKIADHRKNLWVNSLTHFNKVIVWVNSLCNKDADEAYAESDEHFLVFKFVAPNEGWPPWGTSYNLVSKEETMAAYVYKTDRPGLRPDEVKVEIWRGRALWVISKGDEPVKVELPSLNKMRVSEATASMNADCVLTITIPKRDQPWKWYEYRDLVFAWCKTVHVAVSTC